MRARFQRLVTTPERQHHSRCPKAPGYFGPWVRQAAFLANLLLADGPWTTLRCKSAQKRQVTPAPKALFARQRQPMHRDLLRPPRPNPFPTDTDTGTDNFLQRLEVGFDLGSSSFQERRQNEAVSEVGKLFVDRESGTIGGQFKEDLIWFAEV
jgi:hypothetical protein